jgi:hypothetical protein
LPLPGFPLTPAWVFPPRPTHPALDLERFATLAMTLRKARQLLSPRIDALCAARGPPAARGRFALRLWPFRTSVWRSTVVQLHLEIELAARCDLIDVARGVNIGVIEAHQKIPIVYLNPTPSSWSAFADSLRRTHGRSVIDACILRSGFSISASTPTHPGWPERVGASTGRPFYGSQAFARRRRSRRASPKGRLRAPAPCRTRSRFHLDVSDGPGAFWGEQR